MNINDFKECIDGTILKRGYNYYTEGNVDDEYSKTANEYVFQVQGSENYEVTIKLDNEEEIIYSYCDCPYDFGPICKHEAASYFKLQEILNEESVIYKSKNKPSKKVDIKDVLDDLKKEELVNIIIDLTKKDKTLEDTIVFKYSKIDEKNEVYMCRQLINSIVKKYSGSQYFIEYNRVYLFVDEMKQVLEKSSIINNEILALELSILILEEAIKSLQYADDSDGNIGYLISEAINSIKEISLRKKDEKTSGEVFKRLLKLSQNNVFNGFEEFRIEILNICNLLAYNKELKDELKLKIENLIDSNTDDYYGRYTNERLLELIYYIIVDYSSKEEIEDFIKDNLDYSSFRQLLINRYFAKKDYKKVIEIALEGEKKDIQHIGLVLKWKEIRYKAYERLNLRDEQEKLAKELLFAGKFEYYKELKQLSNEENFYENLKNEIKNMNSYNINIFTRLIEEENDLTEILKLVRNNIWLIERYSKKLVKDYKDEVVDIYGMYIKSIAESSTNRSQYKDVCRKIKQYKNIAGKINQDELIDFLISSYRRRPAFIDELSKIK